MDLRKKMKNYGKNVLSQKESKGAERKKRKTVQRLRRTMRNQHAKLRAELEEQVEQELEKQKVLDEYMSQEDAEVTSG